MKISVAICTWNRSRLLRQTLDSLCQLNVPETIQWELVVVDNGSSDDTRIVIEAFSDRLPIHYVLETQAGHSNARNAAIKHVTGDLILWTDNDVLVDPDWLIAYSKAASKHTEAAFFGGKIIPVFEQPKPQWLAETWEMCFPVYAARDLGNDEFELPEHQFPWGANFAVRTEIQQQFLFNAAWGRQSDGMLGDDETECLRRIINAGHRGVWVPIATVEHFIPADRATTRYVSQYFVGQGRANVLKHKPTMNSNIHALGVAIHNGICYRLKKRFVPADEWVSHLIRASIAWGEFKSGVGKNKNPSGRDKSGDQR